MLLGLGLAWTSILRIPLMTSAVRHLDSDLAVDGLVLSDLVEGRWRWHFPGTPHMGVVPIWLSAVQTRLWGTGPSVLVSGGVVAWGLVVVATFLLAFRTFGRRVACWSLVPLVFSSTGLIWLSGRITGGHLTTLLWHVGGVLGMAGCLRRGGVWRCGLLGLWCGLGLWLDTMFAFTIVGIGAAVVVTWTRGRPARSLALGSAFAVGLVVGLMPKVIGGAVDPYDAYGEQFSPIWRADVLAGHARLLAMECLPRLVSGHRLPDGRMLMGAGGRLGRPAEADLAVAWLAMGSFVASVAALAWRTLRGRDRDERAVGVALLVSSAAIGAAFVVNRNIFNSDNYRYLIFWVAMWAVGFGALADGLSRVRHWGRPLAIGLTAAWCVLLTIDAGRWYVEHAWVDDRLRPVWATEAQALLKQHPTATHVFGDYWHVYRLAYLSGGRVVGVPSPFYPNRFAGWSESFDPSRSVLVVLMPAPRDWEALFEAAWVRDGGTPGAWRSAKTIFWSDPSRYFVR